MCCLGILRRVLLAAPVAALLAAPSANLGAQSTSTASPTRRTQPTAEARPAGDKVLELGDFAKWNRISSPAVSADGKWMMFTYTPNEGGQLLLHVKDLVGTQEYTQVVGSGPTGSGGGRGRGGGGNGPSFTDDSHWAAYMVTPEARGSRGRGGAPTSQRGGRGATGAQTAGPAHLELLDLATGDKVEIPNAASWKASGDSRWLAVKLRPTAAAPAAAEAEGAASEASGVVVAARSRRRTFSCVT